MFASMGMMLVAAASAGDFVGDIGLGLALPTLSASDGVGLSGHLSPGYAIELSPDGVMPTVTPEIKIGYQSASFDFQGDSGLLMPMIGARADAVVWKGDEYGKKKRKKNKLVGRDKYKTYVAVGGVLHGGVGLDLSGTSSGALGVIDFGVTADYNSPQVAFGLHATQNLLLAGGGYGGALQVGVHVTVPIQKLVQLASGF